MNGRVGNIEKSEKFKQRSYLDYQSDMTNTVSFTEYKYICMIEGHKMKKI